MAYTAAGLTNGGVTTHYQFQYDVSLSAPGGIEPARTNAVIAACEGDFNLMTEWFGNIAPGVNLPIAVKVNVRANSGGAVTNISDGNVVVTITPTSDAVSYIRYTMVAEVVELFMRAQNRGWFGQRSEGSEGEGLSRFLGAQFLLLNGFGNPAIGILNSNDWLRTDRRDFVNQTDPRDAGPDEKTGCALLFIWYLSRQLGFSTNAIVAAGASSLRAVYRNLTADAADPFPLFKALVDKILPNRATIPFSQGDNPFPATFDGMLVQIRRAGPVRVIYGNARFQLPDAATLARLFPGADVFPCGDFVLRIDTIPDEGTLLQEESSNLVWIVHNRARILAPPHVSGNIHVVWDGGLAQIPIANGIIAGVVTDQDQVPLGGVDVGIASTSLAPSTSGVFQTDAQGRYSSSPLPADTYTIEVVQTGFVPFRTSVVVMSGAPVTPVNVMLERTLPFTIYGKVTDQRGTPVVATVRLTENSAVPGIITIQTGADGRYSITLDPGPYDGDYTVDVRAVGFASQSRVLTIPNGAMIPLNFTLLQQGTLAGHISAEGGPPLGGAKVTAGAFEAFSDATGAYSIMLDPATYAVTASVWGYTPVNATITIPPGIMVPQDFILTRTITGSISGTATDDDGTLLTGVRVAALNTALTTTADDGQYTLNDLQPGPTRVMASLHHYTTDTETVNVISGQTVPQDFVLVRRGTRT